MGVDSTIRAAPFFGVRAGKLEQPWVQRFDDG
jgi:hypothetical protein